MIETEIKVKIDDPDKLRKKIIYLNGIYKLTLEHEDTYFNMPEGLRDFTETDEALRIRNSTEYDMRNRQQTLRSEYFFTYKGKKLDTLTKTREENEILIDNIQKMKSILTDLGFREVLTVVKNRELYEIQFEGELIEVLIDYIPVLESYFLELELIVKSIDEIESAKDILFRLLENLGLKKGDSIRKSYLELILESS